MLEVTSPDKLSCAMVRSLAALVMPFIGGALAHAEAGENLPWAGLRAPREEERLVAQHRLMVLRKAFFEDLRKTFVDDKSRRFHGPGHLATTQMGLWRFGEAVMLLARNIDWSLDKSTMPQGKSYTESMLFPAATALCQIGGGHVRSKAIFEIRLTDDEKKLKLFAWVLTRVEGAEYAVKYLGEEIEKPHVDRVRKRLEKARDYAAKGDLIWADFP